MGSDILYLDCDDVLLDFLPSFTPFVRARGIRLASPTPGSFNMAPWLGLSGEETLALIRDFNEGEDTGFDRMAPIPGAQEAVRQLREAGYRIRVVSSFSDCPAAYNRRAGNLALCFGHDAFEALDATAIGSSKKDILKRHPPGIFVDDLLKNLFDGRAAGHLPILFRAHHNLDMWDTDHTNFLRQEGIPQVAGWSEMLSLLLEGEENLMNSVDKPAGDLDERPMIL